MAKFRVAVVIRQVQKTTGAVRVAVEQIRALRHHGAVVDLVGDQLNPEFVKKHNAEPISIWRWPFSGYFRRRFFANRAEAYCKKENHSLVIGHSDIWHQHVLTMHNCVHLHAEWVDDKPLDSGHEVGRLHKEILKGGGYKVLLANSELMKKDFVKRFAIDPTKVEVHYPPFHKEQFNVKDKARLRGPARAELGVKDNEILIGLVTSGEFKKRGLDYALQSFAKLKELGVDLQTLKFLAVGKDKRTDEYRALAQSLGIADRVIFLDPRPNVESLFHALDIFMLPARLEEFGCSALEAMACGIPVLVSNRCGVAEVLQAKQLIKAPNDINGWAEGLKELITNADWRKSLGRQNGERAPILDSSQFGQRFLQILRQRGLIS